METFSIEIINPKAISILNDLASLNLISIKPKKSISKKESFKKAILKGPIWNKETENEAMRVKKSINKIGNAFT